MDKRNTEVRQTTFTDNNYANQDAYLFRDLTFTFKNH